MLFVYPLSDVAAAFVCVMNKENRYLTVKCLSNFRIINTGCHSSYGSDNIKSCFLDLNMDMEFIEMDMNLNIVLDFEKYNIRL